MFLKDLTNKEILSGKQPKGVCRGVGISLKSHAVKYLLCASSATADTDFSVSTAAVDRIDERITLSKLRPVFPKNCVKLFLGRPVYSFDGAYLGKVTDLELQGFTATNLFTDQDAVYPINAITASQDAVILKKEQPYPIGQRIPAPLLPLVTDKAGSVVTKPILRAAIRKGALIKLTLSLPPFYFQG